MRKVPAVLLLFLFVWGAGAHTQTTNVPEVVDVTGGELFEPSSDELGEIDEVELKFLHDGASKPFGSEIGLEGENLEITGEEVISSDEAEVEAELQDSLEIFQSEVDLEVEADENLLLSEITLIGDRRFKGLKHAYETNTGNVETLSPELETFIDHPEELEDLEYRFYDISDSSELGETWTFTTCGQEGSIGPDQSECDDAYSGSLDGDVTIVDGDSGIQEWEVPFDARYNVTAAGAQGGGDYGGLGAEITAEVNLEQGDTLRIATGQQGDLFDDTFTSGGGGSFVTRVVEDGYEMFDGEEVEPIVVAGGGGGATKSNEDQDSSLSESGNDGATSGTGNNRGSGAGGTGGGGGTNCDNSCSEGTGAGAGFLGDGGTHGRMNDPANAFTTSPPLLGGQEYSDGGFGGGGASIKDIYDRAGGGGGYSGGGSATGSSWAAAGGGGSYLSSSDYYDADLLYQEADSLGQGFVEVEVEANPDQLIGETVENSGDTASVTWPNRENEESYTWSVEVCEPDEETCVFSTSVYEFTVDISDPEASLETEDIYGEHAFWANASVQYGRDEFEEDVNFSLEGSDSEYEFGFDESEEHMERTVESSREVTYSVRVEPENCVNDNCNGEFDFEVLEDVEASVEVEDDPIGGDTASKESEIPNDPPTVEVLNPSDGSLVVGDEATLMADIDDAEGDPVDVRFEDDDGEEICEDEDPQGDITLTCTWEDLGLEEHTWTAVAEDPWSQTSTQQSFTVVISRSYRLEVDFDHRYTALVTSVNSTRTTFVDVENSHPEEREVEASLNHSDEIDAEFGNGEETIEYGIGGGESERVQVDVTGEESGSTELTVIKEDVDLGVETSESINVTVTETEEEYRDIPGLQMLQLLVLFGAAFTLAVLSKS